jgi:uncharacterized membrane protein
MLLLISFSIVLSTNLTFGTVINLILTPYDYTQKQGGTFGMIQCLMSIPGMIFASVMLFGKREVFNTFTLINIFISLVSLMAFNLSFVYMDINAGFYYGLGCVIVNGFFM